MKVSLPLPLHGERVPVGWERGLYLMKERIRTILEDNLPLADLDSDFLFAELSSLDITTIMMLLSDEYHITLDSRDVSPKNFMTVDSIVAMVQRNLEEKK